MGRMLGVKTSKVPLLKVPAALCLLLFSKTKQKHCKYQGLIEAAAKQKKALARAELTEYECAAFHCPL